MTASYAKVLLSGSTNGRGVKVAATASPGTTIHTAVSGTASWDEIWLYVFNSDTAAHDLTLQWGGTSSPDDTIKCTIPALSGLQLVTPGLLLQNSLIVKAFCDSANKLIIHGWVNRIT